MEKDDPAPDPERGDQRPEQPARHAGDGAHARRRAARTSQFYINLADNPSLDYRGFSPDDFGYAVFGRVLEGMDVVDKIGAVTDRPRATAWRTSRSRRSLIKSVTEKKA